MAEISTKKSATPAVKTAKKPAVKAAKKKVSKKPVVTRESHTIDATGQALGRLATQISTLLQGKNKATYLRHVDSGDLVVVTNASKVKFSGNKLDSKLFYHYSGYPGGLKTKKLSEVFAKNPTELVRMTVWNMLPKNKLRENMIKRLQVSK